MNEIFTVTQKMIEWFSGDRRRIQHLLKVHAYARHIAIGEGLDDAARTTVEIAALVHDIGIRPAEEQFGRADGKLQEQLGPQAAREVLGDLCGVSTLDRVAFLVGHHHTYTGVRDLDLRILIEADALVNLAEEDARPKAVQTWYRNVFRTQTGQWLCRTVFADAFA